MFPGDNIPAELSSAVRESGGGAPERLFAALYDQLHNLAGRVRQGRASETLSTTALVHEAWIKLASAERVEVDSRLHFFRLAACAMRQILVDAARERLAEKRGGDVMPVTFDDALQVTPMPASSFLALDRAIDRRWRVSMHARRKWWSAGSSPASAEGPRRGRDRRRLRPLQ